MSFAQIVKRLLPFVKPYKLLILATLLLTLVGSCLAQVNALALEYAVNSVTALTESSAVLRFSR